QRLVEIGAVGMRHGADGFLCRRIEHGDGPARLARPPFAVDEQLSIGICHETCSLFYCRRMANGPAEIRRLYDRSPAGLQSRFNRVRPCDRRRARPPQTDLSLQEQTDLSLQEKTSWLRAG